MAAKKSNQKREAGDRLVVPVDGLEIAFRWCPDDKFMMGPPESQHEVKLTKGFWIMETPVTVGMFEAFVEDNEYQSVGYSPWALDGNRIKQNKKRNFSWRNPGYKQEDNYPVTCISWIDAEAFCKWLKDKTGLTMRLPTEAEWEYACRAGKAVELLSIEKLKEIAWIPENSNNQAHPVTEDPTKAEKYHNDWHIYDMIGNVREWCFDAYGEYPNGSVTNPMGAQKGKLRIVRGGSWASEFKYCQPTGRLSYCLPYRSSYQGFRVVCVCEQQ